VTWTNDRGGSGTCSGTTSWSQSGISLFSGSNVITVTARDAAGNTRSDTLTVTYTPPDTTRPTVTITSPTSGTTYTASSSSLTIAGTASDNVGVTQVTWTNDRGGSGTCSGTTSWSQNGISLSSGTNVITVTARDAAGNTRSDTLTVTYTPPDTTRPTVTITSPTSGTTYTTSSSSLTIAGTASDNVGVTQVTWANDFGPGGICSGTTSWSQTGVPLFSGENLITVTARDAAGNTRSDTLTVTYTPPVTTRRLTVQGGSTGTGFVSSTPSGFSCSIDGTNESGVCSQTYSSGTEVTLLADPSRGSTIDGWSVGGCGTATSCSVTMDQAQTVTVFFKLPPVPPTISNISQTLVVRDADYCVNSSGTFTGTIFDIRFEYSDINGDVSKSGGATVDAGFDATPFSTFSGDGFSGSITSNLCFAGSSRDVTMTLTDNSGLSSNSLTVRVSP